jgi:pilus assembly protein CpaB
MGWRSWVKNRNVVLTSAALFVGGCAYLLAQRYLHGQEVAVRAQLAGHYAARDVLVAARDLPAGSVIEASMLARRAVPARFLASDALDAAAVSGALGRRLARAMRSGEAVTASALLAETDLPLSSLVKPGLRALTIPVDESSAAAGMLSPGDLVDLLLVTRGNEATAGAPAVRPLLQAVAVVATGQQLRRRRSGAGADRGADESQSAAGTYSTVTLHVRAEDAERILLAQRLGELAVLLRPESDTEPTALRRMDAATLLESPPRYQPRSIASPVEFIVGGTGGVHTSVRVRRSAP